MLFELRFSKLLESMVELNWGGLLWSQWRKPCMWSEVARGFGKGSSEWLETRIRGSACIEDENCLLCGKGPALKERVREQLLRATSWMLPKELCLSAMGIRGWGGLKWVW